PATARGSFREMDRRRRMPRFDQMPLQIVAHELIAAVQVVPPLFGVPHSAAYFSSALSKPATHFSEVLLRHATTSNLLAVSAYSLVLHFMQLAKALPAALLLAASHFWFGVAAAFAGVTISI